MGGIVRNVDEGLAVPFGEKVVGRTSVALLVEAKDVRVRRCGWLPLGLWRRRRRRARLHA